MTTTSTRPSHPPRQTLAQARAAYRKHGPRISSQEQRQLDRGNELLRRAEKLRQAETRKKQAAEKKRVKDEKEREARRRMGMPEPRPLVALSQKVLDGFCMLASRTTTNSRPLVGEGQKDTTEEMVLTNYVGESPVPKAAKAGIAIAQTTATLTSLGNVTTVSDTMNHTNTANVNLARRTNDKYPERNCTITTQSSNQENAVGSFWSDEDLDDGTLLAVTEPVQSTTASPALGQQMFSHTIASQTRPSLAIVQDTWDDFFPSDTQVQKEITVSPLLPKDKFRECGRDPEVDFNLLSTQELMPETEKLPTYHTTLPFDTTIPNTLITYGRFPTMSDKQRVAMLMPPPKRPAVPIPAVAKQPQRHMTNDFMTMELVLSSQDLRDFGD